MGGGVLFLGRALTTLLAGPPPASGDEILAWIEGARVVMIWGNEALVIGAALLLAGLYGIHQALTPRAPMAATAGTLLLIAVCTVCLVLGIFQGRFVYPVHGLALSRPEDAELLVMLYFGGNHLVALGFAAATVFWALAMRSNPTWRAFGYAGFPAAAASILGSYPELIGPLALFAMDALQALWWVAIGIQSGRRLRSTAE